MCTYMYMHMSMSMYMYVHMHMYGHVHVHVYGSTEASRLLGQVFAEHAAAQRQTAHRSQEVSLYAFYQIPAVMFMTRTLVHVASIAICALRNSHRHSNRGGPCPISACTLLSSLPWPHRFCLHTALLSPLTTSARVHARSES